METQYTEKGDFKGRAKGPTAVKTHGEIVIAHIKYRTFVRLSLFALSGLLLVTAAWLVVFAPVEKQSFANYIGVALFAIAAGSAGFGTFAIQLPPLSARAGNDENSN